MLAALDIKFETIHEDNYYINCPFKYLLLLKNPFLTNKYFKLIFIKTDLIYC